MILKFRSVAAWSLVLFCSVAIAAQDAKSPAVIGQPATNSRDDRYRIGYRDKLNIQVFRHAELNQTVTVNPNGTIILFRLPEPIPAVCKTELQLAGDIAAAYKKDYLKNPEVQVVATEQMSQSFAVTGAVEKPANYYVNRRVRLLELLAFAGGPSKEAGSRVVVVRNGSSSGCDQTTPETDANAGTFSFKLRDLQEGKQNLQMQPGDYVWVMPTDFVFVYGNVNEQGKVEMRQPLTLMQAIASAKGLKPASKKDNVRIIRQKPDSLEPEVFTFDLNKIDKQKGLDPFLQPNDIVAVSEDKTKSILNGIRNSMTQGIPSLFYRIP